MSSIALAGLSLLGGALSPAGINSKLAILIYHRVLSRRDPLAPGEPTAQEFDWQMGVLKRYFAPLPLTEAAERLEAGTLPARAVAVTFDDGYADNFHVALPVLCKWGIPATFFITTGFLNGGRMWNDTVIETIRAAKGDTLDLRELELGVHAIDTDANRLHTLREVLPKLKYFSPADRAEKVQQLAKKLGEQLPDDLMMTTEQVRLMRGAGMEIGAHTINHPILARLSPQEAEVEIVGGLNTLESMLGQSVTSFAYPNGRPGVDYDRSHVEVVRKAGFKVCVSTAWGCARRNDDIFQLPRISTWDKKPHQFSARILKSYVKRTAVFV